MRVCVKHMKLASETLRSLKTGEEFDLCPDCELELREIIHGTNDKPSESVRDHGPGRSVGRPKKTVS